MTESLVGGGPETASTDDSPRPPARKGVPVVFLDKDGTLVEDVPYNVDAALLRFTPNAIEALRLLAGAGFSLAVVTNQPGLEGGRFSESEFADLRHALVERVRAEAGVEIAAFEFCPHLPGERGKPVCACRKPGSAMLERVAAARHVDLARSWMVGDILDDIEAGRRAGCRTVLLDVGNETQWRWTPLRTPHHRCSDLLEAARIIAGSQ
jgi:histidinol-phosphate phosphatase family protein